MRVQLAVLHFNSINGPFEKIILAFEKQGS
jgi:hypothetical protein